MPRPAFSRDYRLWGDWKKAQNPNSSYFRQIEKLHKIFPDKSLKALRELKKGYIPPSKKSITDLSPVEKEKRKIGFHIIRKMQPSAKSKGMSMRAAVRDYNLNNFHGKKIKVSEIIEAMGDYIKKGRKGRYEFNPKGKLELRHNIYSKGEYREVTISNEKERAIVKEYQRDLQKLLHGQSSMSREEFYEKYNGVTVKDAKGKKVELEADVDKIREDMYRRGDNYVVTLSG